MHVVHRIVGERAEEAPSKPLLLEVPAVVAVPTAGSQLLPDFFFSDAIERRTGCQHCGKHCNRQHEHVHEQGRIGCLRHHYEPAASDEGHTPTRRQKKRHDGGEAEHKEQQEVGQKYS